MDTIFLDLSKAFGKVPTSKLVRRLKRCGFRGKILAFCRNFLEGRRQIVIANGQTSEEREVTSGTPQGACLSPLFFCLYISPVVDLLETFTKEEEEKQKDIPENKKRSFWAFFFADDSKLSGSFKEEKEMNTLQNCQDLTLG